MAGVIALGASKSIPKSSQARTSKAAWAAYCRNRWPQNTLASIMAEWPLSEGEARRLLYSDGSQAVFDKCTAGDPLLALDLLLVRFRLGAEDLAQRIEEKHENARRLQEAQREPERRFSRVLASDPRSDESAPEGQVVEIEGRRNRP